MGPRFRAGAVDGRRKLHVQSDAEAIRDDLRTDRAELQIGLPLQILVVFDALGVLGGEAFDRARAGVVKRHRPCGPAPDRGILGEIMLLDRFEQAMQAQRFAASHAIAAECVAALASGDQMLHAKVRVEKLEDPQLCRSRESVPWNAAEPTTSMALSHSTKSAIASTSR